MIERLGDTQVPTRWGICRCVAYRRSQDGVEHVALVVGDIAGASEPLVRVHSECLTGDVFGSQRCDCGPQLDLAMQRIVADGVGAVVYLRGHEGRGVGLGSKIMAYALQDGGLDTVDANVALGLPVDDRDFADSAEILLDLGVSTVRLLTNNPAKIASLEANAITVAARESIVIAPTATTATYLRTKRDRLGHLTA